MEKISQTYDYAFDLFLNNNNLTIVDINRDGHCLINAILYNLTQIDYDQMINEILRESTNSEWSEYFVDKNTNYSESMKSYLFQKIWNQGAIDVVPIIISKIIKSNIIIYKINSNNTFYSINTAFDLSYENKISILLTNDHYEAIACNNNGK